MTDHKEVLLKFLKPLQIFQYVLGFEACEWREAGAAFGSTQGEELEMYSSAEEEAWNNTYHSTGIVILKCVGSEQSHRPLQTAELLSLPQRGSATQGPRKQHGMEFNL